MGDDAHYHGLLMERLREYAYLPPAAAGEIAPILRTLRLPKSAYFIRHGETPSTAGYIIRGTLRYFHIDEDGREYTRYFCREGNFVSAYTSLTLGEPSRYSIQAVDEVLLVVFDYEAWLAVVSRHPALGGIAMKILDRAHVLAEERERSLMLDDAETRYRKLLAAFPDIQSTVKQYDIASYLGITPVALSRVRKRLGNKK